MIHTHRPVSRRRFLKDTGMAAGAGLAAAWLSSCARPPQPGAPPKIASGPFQPAWESLAQGYKCPEWFQDAKFGIWAHWSAQCVPEQGDWYARLMYIQGHPDYEHHLKNYGHPSKTGFMDIDHAWKAENWRPDQLLDLYVRAGAKYFVALANHHDNFDNYDSKYHAWNSVNVGPKKDLIGIWAKEARARGLRFGVTNHSAHAWHWFQTAYGYDGEGPLAGVRYDAFRLTKADGAGQWWEGLDPQELYAGRNIVMPDGLTSMKAVHEWLDKYNNWTEDVPPNNTEFTRKWFLRCQDLVDKYRPDLLYFDDAELPLGQTGLDIAAHYYNASLNWHRGDMQVVLNGKRLPEEKRRAMVEDYERGFADDIKPQPWQTDTCIGSWHYQRDIQYKSVGQVVRMLTDIVSKNGNLLLNIPVRGDGTIDDREHAFLAGLTKWMDANSEGIFATRPWKVFGEGPSKVKGGMFNENKLALGAQDIRFTSKGSTLYAYFLGWPDDGKLTIESLAAGAADKPTLLDKPIAHVSLLGTSEPVEWTRDTTALRVTLPATKPGEHVYALKLV
jgi:alpha-L-fucosidase